MRFQDFSNSDISILAEEVLKEVPDQIVGYMMSKGIKPAKQDWENIESAISAQTQ